MESNTSWSGPKISIIAGLMTVILKSVPAARARSMLETGPAIDTSRTPWRGFLKTMGFTGTGLAQPNAIIPRELTRSMMGRRIVPIGSI